MTDVRPLLGSLQRQGATLQLDTPDLCFLVALHVRSQAAVSLEEELLHDVWDQVCDLVDPGAATPRRRALHALRKMRDQRLLARVDGAGLVRAGQYALTRLGTAIAEYFLHEDLLTRESLAVLTRTLASQLSEVLHRAREARSTAEWRREVVEPLQVTVRDLVAGLERRQRGLDAQQEEVRARIAELLSRDWFEAVEACEKLLAETASTLRELHEMLLQDTARLQSLLQEIEVEAGAREEEVGAREAEAAVQGVSEQVDRVAAWGAERLEAWSEYFRSVQRYLRNVVRLDPQRALSQRLRDQLAGWTDRPWTLVAVQAEPVRLLRQPDPRPQRAPVARPPRDREAPPESLEGEAEADGLEDRVREALAGGAGTLSEVVLRVLPTRPEAKRFGSVGRVAELVAREAHLAWERERPWVRVDEGLEIEEWTVRP